MMGIENMNGGKSKRVRIALSAFAIGALGAGVLVAAPWSASETSVEASVELVSTSTCYDMVSIAIGGRGDTPREGVKWLTKPDGTRLPAAMSGDYSSDWIDQAVRAPNNGNVVPDSYAAVYVEYPADLASYENAVQTGVTNSQTIMKEISASCPKTRFAIVGYSEGADVARRTAMEIGNQAVPEDGKYGIIDPSQVVGVVIFADAGRVAGEGPFPGAENPFSNPDGFDTKYQNGNNAIPGQGALPGTSGGFGALDGRVASFCSDGDLTCALPANTSLIHLAANVGRQVNADALQNENLTPATGADLALALGRIAVNAFNDIASQPNWMQSDETFLDVLIKVSEPNYKPGTATTPVSAKVDGEEPIETGQMVDMVYLPQKIFKEITGFISSNQNTIPVIMNDPYGLTLGPGSGHHFDYWRDADAANGKPLTSVQYAAAWLTQLAEQANRGEPVKTKEVQEKAGRAAIQAIAATPETTTSATATPTATTPAPITTSPAAPAAPVAPAPAPAAEVPAPAPAPAPAAEPAEPACTTPVEGEPPVEGAPPVCVTAPATETPVTPEAAAPTTTVAPTP